MTYAEHYTRQGVEQGMKQGRQEGRQDAMLEVTKRLLASGCSIADICKYTGLSAAEVEKLQINH